MMMAERLVGEMADQMAVALVVMMETLMVDQKAAHLVVPLEK